MPQFPDLLQQGTHLLILASFDRRKGVVALRSGIEHPLRKRKVVGSNPGSAMTRTGNDLER